MKILPFLPSFAGALSVSALVCFILRYLHPATFSPTTAAMLVLLACLVIAGYIASQRYGD